MADLDDFFAKKDKKKKAKKGPKYSNANTDVLAKNLLESARKEENAEKKAAAPLATSEANKAGAINNDRPGVEEEWKDYEEEKKDFSNLKIETLRIESDPEADDEDEHEIDEETGEVRIKKSDSAGPWNKVAGGSTNDEESSPDVISFITEDKERENNIEECTICLEDITANVMILNCKHSFHKKCINKWLSKKHECPNCRAYDLLENEFPPLEKFAKLLQ